VVTDVGRGAGWPWGETDSFDVDQYLEVIGQFTQGSSEYALRFVLEDSSDEDFRPSVDFVSNTVDFSGP